jgi:hypothetical protein
MIGQDVALIRVGQAGHTRMLDMLQQHAQMNPGRGERHRQGERYAGRGGSDHHDLNRVQRELAELQAVVDDMRGRR